VVTCADCGYLFVRDTKTMDPREAIDSVREHGRQNNADTSGAPANLYCYKARPELPGKSFDPNEIVRALNQAHDCPEWTKYLPGKMPKEHEEMAIVEKVREENRLARLQDKRDRDAERETDRKRDARKYFWTEFRSWAAIAVAVVAALIASYAASR